MCQPQQAETKRFLQESLQSYPQLLWFHHQKEDWHHMHEEHPSRGKHSSLNLSVRSIYWWESPIYLTAAQNAFGCLSHVGNVLGNASQLHQSQANPGGCVFGSLPSQKCVGSQAPGARGQLLSLNTLLRGPGGLGSTAWKDSLGAISVQCWGWLCHPASAPLTPSLMGQ